MNPDLALEKVKVTVKEVSPPAPPGGWGDFSLSLTLTLTLSCYRKTALPQQRPRRKRKGCSSRLVISTRWPRESVPS